MILIVGDMNAAKSGVKVLPSQAAKDPITFNSESLMRTSMPVPSR